VLVVTSQSVKQRQLMKSATNSFIIYFYDMSYAKLC